MAQIKQHTSWYSLDSVPADQRESLGGKAAGIAALLAAGVRVPKSCAVVPGEPFDAAEVAANVAKRLGRGPFFARSSFAVEDTSRQSFAGQAHSIGHLDRDDVAAAVQQVWESWQSPHAVAYRTQFDLPDARSGSVVVQCEIAPVWSGVLFSRSPEAVGDWARIEATKGYGDALVAGRIDPVVVEFERNSGRTLEPVGRPFFTIIKQLRSMLGVIESVVSGVADVEWCLDARGKVWILQARPATLVTSRYWSSVLSEEFWSGQVSPLMFSTVGRVIEHAMLREPLEIATGPLPDSLLRLYQQRVYVDAGALAYALNVIPGWAVTSRLLDMFPPPIRERYLAEQAAYGPRFPPALRRVAGKFLRAGFPWWPLQQPLQVRKLLRDAEAWKQRPLPATAQIPEEIRALLDDLAATLRWVSWGMLYAYILAPLLDAMLGKQTELEGAGSLYSNLPQDPVTELDRDLAQFVRDHPDVLQHSYETWRRRAANADVHAAYDALVQKWSHRAEARDLAAPRWCDRPADVWSLLQLVPQRSTHMRQHWLRWLVQRCGPLWSPVRWPRLFLLVVLTGLTRLYLGYRERMRDIADRYLLALRRRLLAIAPEQAPWDLVWTGSDLEVNAALSPQETDQTPPRFLLDDTPLSTSDSGESALSGQGVSPGAASGRAVWIRDIGDVERFRPGDILLAQYLDPSFSIVLEASAAAAFVSGGLLSHGAIIAREYGVPAVVGIRDLASIKDGDPITVDGTQGLVFHDD